MPHPATTNEQQIRSSTTDLDTGYDRSRAGSGPISVRSTTDLGEIGWAEDQTALVALGAQASPRAVSDNPASTPSGLTSTTTS